MARRSGSADDVHEGAVLAFEKVGRDADLVRLRLSSWLETASCSAPTKAAQLA